MARTKETVEQKAAKAALKENTLQIATAALKHLSFTELDELIGLANRQNFRSYPKDGWLKGLLPGLNHTEDYRKTLSITPKQVRQWFIWP